MVHCSYSIVSSFSQLWTNDRLQLQKSMSVKFRGEKTEMLQSFNKAHTLSVTRYAEVKNTNTPSAYCSSAFYSYTNPQTTQRINTNVKHLSSRELIALLWEHTEQIIVFLHLSLLDQSILGISAQNKGMPKIPENWSNRSLSTSARHVPLQLKEYHQQKPVSLSMCSPVQPSPFQRNKNHKKKPTTTTNSFTNLKLSKKRCKKLGLGTVKIFRKQICHNGLTSHSSVNWI